jgi:cytochrome c oxidase subunit II
MNPRSIFGHAFGIETLVAAAVFTAVCLVILAAMAASRHRRRTGKPASQREENTKLEAAYALAVAAVAAFIVYLSFSTTSDEQAKAQADATRIDITAFQWCWQFSYPDGARTVTGTCSAGERPTMVVPVDTPITVRIRSEDVIHSWWVPQLRYKLDAFPDHTNTVTFRMDHTGRWPGRCAEFCGHGHVTMDFYLQAVSSQRYKQWLSGGAATA